MVRDTTNLLNSVYIDGVLVNSTAITNTAISVGDFVLFND